MINFLKVLFITVILFLLCLLFQTCKNDKSCIKSTIICENFPEPQGGISRVTQKSLQSHSPFYNPNNGKEFIFLRENNDKFQLVKYNLENKSEIVLIDNSDIVGQPKWGKNGWIVYISSDYQINLLKEDGSVSKKITNSNFHLFPDWLNDSTLLVEFSFNLGVPYFNSQVTSDGSIIDTIRNSSFRNGSVNIIGESAYQLYTINPTIFIRDKIIESKLVELENNGRFQITGIVWHPNNSDVYYSTYREGLFKVNRFTKLISKIMDGCDSKSYRSLCISPDGNNILVERVGASDYQNTTGSWTEESKIIIMDINGNNERNVFD